MYDNKLLDDIGKQILKTLQEEGRISFNELGRRVGLSSPAVAERVRRMEEAGVILGYKAVVNHSRIGYPIMAFINLVVPVAQLSQADELATSIPEVLECHHITGRDVIILKVAVTSVGHLEDVINQMGVLGMTTTAVVLSSPIAGRPLNVPKQPGA
ncbi:MAG: Lrp/AsnC family transcriptional regulator [Synergistaceae bacterium]|jgi:Lrp/AsnC family leucine-responsive transcriptional regulator|nr:Lrp/AsnC family transcriptional regulator [Synergistaceae bacterium]